MKIRHSILVATLAGVLSAGTAGAGDVTIYGRIDLGLGYAHEKSDVAASTDTLSMDASSGTSSRFGIKGEEELGNGLKVKFVLENGFKPDTGELGTSGSLFDRESTLQIIGSFGTLSFGRVTILGTDGGSFNLLGNVNPTGTGLGNIGNQNTVFAGMPSSRYDNMITWRSPVFGGAQLTAEYSMGSNDLENKSGTNRYLGIGATWAGGPAEAVLLFESVNEAANAGDYPHENPKDLWRVTAGGNVDFGMMKVYAGLHCFRNANSLGGSSHWSTMKDYGIGSITTDQIKGLDALKGASIVGGISVPAAGGSFIISAGALKAKTDELTDTLKITNVNAGAGYFYPLSKRSKLYGGAGWSGSTFKSEGKSVKPEAVYAVAGLMHYF